MKRRGEGKTLRNIDAPHYSIWQALYMSFYSARLYVDVLKRWKGFGLVYLLIILMLLTLPLSFQTFRTLNTFLEKEVYHPIRAIEKIHIQNGLVQLDKPMPWKIKNAQGNTELIIDTSGEITAIDSKKYPDLRILITENSLLAHFPFYKKLANKHMDTSYPTYHEVPFQADMTGDLTGNAILKVSGLLYLRWFALIAVWPMFFSAFFGMYLALIFTLAMMGQVIASAIFRFPLGYRECVRLMMVSATPQCLLVMFTLTTGRMNAIAGVLVLALIAIYFSYAVLANRRAGRKMVRQ